jgi:hypothetical protein
LHEALRLHAVLLCQRCGKLLRLLLVEVNDHHIGIELRQPAAEALSQDTHAAGDNCRSAFEIKEISIL